MVVVKSFPLPKIGLQCSTMMKIVFLFPEQYAFLHFNNERIVSVETGTVANGVSGLSYLLLALVTLLTCYFAQKVCLTTVTTTTTTTTFLFPFSLDKLHYTLFTVLREIGAGSSNNQRARQPKGPPLRFIFIFSVYIHRILD